MKVRWISLGVAIGLALALTVAFGFASGRSTLAAAGHVEGWAAMQAMHDSPAMQRVHAQMPEELRAECEAMHEQMDQMMQAGGMMGGGMTGGDMSAHHSGPTGDSMMSGGSGMMGSGSGMMGS